jgi:anthranilate synthase component 2
MRILLLDNFDSFTYNLAHYCEGEGCSVDVIDNATFVPSELLNYGALIISPGPGLPQEAGNLMKVIDEAFKMGIPVLGVCLGMQAIAEYFGDVLYNQDKVKHGVCEWITVGFEGSLLFNGLENRQQVGLYHSWAVEIADDSQLIVTSYSDSGVAMSLQHRDCPIHGVQFHPESIMTTHGKEMIRNFLTLVS